MEAQVNPTACWISVAHFCLNALGVQVAGLAPLAAQYQNNTGGNSAMDGAGKPELIIEEWSRNAGVPYQCRSEKFERAPEGPQLRRIADAIIAGAPVICELRTTQIQGFKHAIVLYEAQIDADGGIIFKYKDSARKAEANLGRTVTAAQLFGSGFVYKKNHGATAYVKGADIWTYSKRVIFIKKC
jgi:hypothetical protein